MVIKENTASIATGWIDRSQLFAACPGDRREDMRNFIEEAADQDASRSVA